VLYYKLISFCCVFKRIVFQVSKQRRFWLRRRIHWSVEGGRRRIKHWMGGGVDWIGWNWITRDWMKRNWRSVTWRGSGVKIEIFSFLSFRKNKNYFFVSFSFRTLTNFFFSFSFCWVRNFIFVQLWSTSVAPSFQLQCLWFSHIRDGVFRRSLIAFSKLRRLNKDL